MLTQISRMFKKLGGGHNHATFHNRKIAKTTGNIGGGILKLIKLKLNENPYGQ